MDFALPTLTIINRPNLTPHPSQYTQRERRRCCQHAGVSFDRTSLVELRTTTYVPQQNCSASATAFPLRPFRPAGINRFLVLTVVAPPLNHLDGEIEQRRRY